MVDNFQAIKQKTYELEAVTASVGNRLKKPKARLAIDRAHNILSTDYSEAIRAAERREQEP
jgi:hypothetical protein